MVNDSQQESQKVTKSPLEDDGMAVLGTSLFCPFTSPALNNL